MIVLAGDLGAGKTAFVQGFGRGLGVTGSHHEPHLHPRPRLRGPPPGAPPRRVPPRADERGPRPRAARDARRRWRRAHRVGRRHPPGAARTTSSRCGSPSGVGDDDRHVAFRAGRARPGRPAPTPSPVCSAPGWRPDADPRDHHLHRAGRLRHRRARGRPRRRSSPRAAAATPRRSPLPSSSSAGRPASSSADIGAIAVDLGPGMFTGLRVGVAAGKALSHARRLPMIGVTSLDLLAFPLRHSHRRIVCAARRRPRRDLPRQLPAVARRRAAASPSPRSASPADLASDLLALGEEVLLAGDGALRYQSVFEPVRRVEMADRSEAYPLAGSLVQLAHARALREDFVSPAELTPDLPPQARRRDQLDHPRRSASLMAARLPAARRARGDDRSDAPSPPPVGAADRAAGVPAAVVDGPVHERARHPRLADLRGGPGRHRRSSATAA